MGNCYHCRYFTSYGSVCELGIYGEDAEECTYDEEWEDYDGVDDWKWRGIRFD